MLRRFFGLLFVMLISVGCQQDEVIIPTLANPEAVATGFVLTENAPPAGYDTIAFERIDANLTDLAGWRYEMEIEFNGRFAQTSRNAHSRTQATVAYRQLDSARRVVATVSQNLQGEDRESHFEGVRLGQDAFLVRDGNCMTNAAEDAAFLADLSAGDLIGGVQEAYSAAQKATINGVAVWRYEFEPDAIILRQITLNENSRILSLNSELWVAPEYDAVVRYYLTMEVENILLADNTVPVSGTLVARYDLFDIGEEPNINVPFGC